MAGKILSTYFLDESTFNIISRGFFPILKPKGITSAQILEQLKEAIFKDIRKNEVVRDEQHTLKVGHGGVLDSTASGVLAVGVCYGCKVLPLLLNGSKNYTVTGQLGIATNTYNETGTVTETLPYDHITEDKFKATIKTFQGNIMQKPPVFSALKRSGVRLSDLARKGEEVEVQPRKVSCYNVTCTAFNPPHFTLDVECSKGFYIRSLVHDLGKALGSAAYVTTLVRTRHGPFVLEECLKPEDFSLQNVITWIKLSRKQHSKLTKYLDKLRANDADRIKNG